MNAERYRLATSKKRARKSAALTPADDSHHGPLEQEGGGPTPKTASRRLALAIWLG